ncbi:MAG: transcriptional regulator NrdR [Bdellovibrionales bacterium]|nr:transcriptional regulator NrdR [Bdellovibrionales bacterium]
MKCPNCEQPESRVLETRVHREGEIRRRRECLKCKHRFTTVETLLVQYAHVVKKDGRREPFSREKLRRGIQIACKKRAVSIAEIEEIVNKISKWALSASEKELYALEIGQLVVKELRKLDDVAYVRFASVYKNFRDLNEFVESLSEQEQAAHSGKLKTKNLDSDLDLMEK